MNIKKTLLLLIFLTTFLGACTESTIVDIAKNIGKSYDVHPEKYFEPGVELYIADDKTAFIYGTDPCPHASVHIDKTCVKLTGTTSTIVILKFDDGSTLTEQWSIDQSDDRITITRPNGFQVRHSPLYGKVL